MSKHGKSIWKDWTTWAIAIVAIILISGIIILCTRNSENSITTSKQIHNSNVNNIKEISDNDIINFAKQEIKKKLRYPETARFSYEEVKYQDNNKYLIHMYCTSNTTTVDEGRILFSILIEKKDGNLSCAGIATNGETCNVDVSKEFEELIKNKDYEKVYDELFSSTAKKITSKEEFLSYNLDLDNCEFTSTPQLDDKGLLKYVTVYIKDNKVSNNWIQIIQNGLIKSFAKVGKYN